MVHAAVDQASGEVGGKGRPTPLLDFGPTGQDQAETVAMEHLGQIDDDRRVNPMPVVRLAGDERHHWPRPDVHLGTRLVTPAMAAGDAAHPLGTGVSVR